MNEKETSSFPAIQNQPRSSAMKRRQKVALSSLGLILVGCVAAGWLNAPDYTYRPPTIPTQEDQNARGLTVLVSFSDRVFPEDQAALVYRALNEKNFVHTEGATTYRGSVRDYFGDMSQGKFDLQSRVLHVRLPYTFAEFDTDKGDDLAPFTSSTQLEDVKFVGPLARLTQAVTCKLADCTGIETPQDWLVEKSVEFQEVSASGFGPAQNTGDAFANLSRKSYSFWFDNFLREVSKSTYLLDPELAHQYVQIPDIEGFSYVSVVYNGTNNQSYGKGLWPRSVPQLKSVVDPASGTPIVHPQLLGTRSTSGMPDLPLLIHESAHSLFELPDLYDSGLEREVVPVNPDIKSRGVGTHALMGLTPSGPEAPLMSAPMRDRLGWASVIDISDLPEGTVVELDANSAQTARYCRPHSAMEECFYIEARLKDGKRFGTDRSAYVPDSGLAIWHAEYRKDVTDFVVNNHEEADRNLHFEVALMQADGNRELESGIAGESNDYFRQGRQDFFDEFGKVNSKWWDGAPSGLAIRNISSAGARMSFVVGKRPQTNFLVSTDSHVRASWDQAPIRVGDTRKVSIQVDPGYAFDVIAEEDKYLARHQTSALNLDIKGQLDNVKLRLVSYPAALAEPTPTATASISYQIGEGARVTSYADSARTYKTTSRMFDRYDYWANFYASGKTGSARIADMQLPLTAENTQLPLNVVAEEGFVLTGLRVTGRNNGYVETFSGPTTRFQADVTLPSSQEGYDVVVEAEPIVNYFCSTGRIPTWNPDKVYSDLGDKVRYQNAIYASNVPRNFLRSSGATPANSPNHWTKFVDCSTTTYTCTGMPTWTPGTTNAQVQQGSQLYNRAGKATGDENGAMPGNHVSYLLDDAAERFAQVEKDLGLYSNRLFAYPDDADWNLAGSCSDVSSFRRAAVQLGAGVTNLTSTLPLSSPGGVTPRLNRDPYFVEGASSGWRLTFALEAGYTLDGVYVNGVRQTGVVPGTSFQVPVSTTAPAPYVEIRSNCSSAQCRATPAVSCQIVVDSQWNSPNSSGFNGRMTIKNLTTKPLTTWSSMLSIRPSNASWQGVWTSIGASSTLTGPDAKVTKANTSLASGQSTVFSFGGQWNGAYVPPTCQGM